MTGFAPIASIVAEVWGVSDALVETTVTVFTVSFVLLNFVSVEALEKYGAKTTVSNIFVLSC